MLTGILPLFPLPRLVLLPGLSTGLHIFEPRYRAMVADALGLDSEFILVRSRQETESDLVAPAASIFEVGTRVRIIASEALPDGRFDLLVQGLDAVRILEEVPGEAYRQVRWAVLAAAPETWDGPEKRHFLDSLQGYLKKSNIQIVINDSFDLESIDNHWIPSLAASFDLPPPELQFLLEAGTLREMARRLASLLDFAAEGRSPRES
ncbi:MAG: LON peptidase substrate-binding domain-containing protein [Holophagaceae bacterium]|nr:LON peptidase substrate-binding domain-containing protein [Holophagaceae bacterium]